MKPRNGSSISEKVKLQTKFTLNEWLTHLGVQGVKNCFNQQDIDSASEQTPNLCFVSEGQIDLKRWHKNPTPNYFSSKCHTPDLLGIRLCNLLESHVAEIWPLDRWRNRQCSICGPNRTCYSVRDRKMCDEALG
jgi:hypothetical protein